MFSSAFSQQPQSLTYTIDSPNVSRPATPYPQYRFATGDRVVVEANGCVQTGGSGRTWKSYVDPHGPNSDRFYHGLISIPGATAGLVRINAVVHRVLTVGPVNAANAYLTLGYEDDDYSDNSYRDHDDGTGDQCKGQGAALVIVTVTRPAAPAGPVVVPPPPAHGFPAATGAGVVVVAPPAAQPHPADTPHPQADSPADTDGGMHTTHGAVSGDDGPNHAGAANNSGAGETGPKSRPDTPNSFVSFVTSISGFLTALATLITALVGIYALRRKS